MCGISGIINKNGSKVEYNDIKKINDIISHRGPDDEGFFIDKNFAFGHRRLSVIDLSQNGHQPMHYLNRYCIIYNGEIYNYLEIKDELIALNYEFISNTDTEVLVAAYDKWGVDCLNKFNGMWAFAIYDRIRNNIILARDRFGVKPLYYSNNDSNFIFGSEIKQIVATFDDAVYVNEKILIESLLTHIDGHTEETYFANVFALLQGHYLIYDFQNNSYNIFQYYTLKVDNSLYNLDEKNAIIEFQDRINTSVNLRLRSDVTVGTCLSGGLDSSSISAIASKEYSKSTEEKFIAIHAKSIESNNDESLFAKSASAALGLDLHIVEPSTEDFIKTIDEVVYTQEEPFGSPSMFMGYHVFQKAKELHCKVMLNGQGGDEVLLGYERYYSSYLKSLRISEFAKEIFLQFKNSKLKLWEPIFYYFYFTNYKIRKWRLLNKSHLKKSFKNNFDFKYIKNSAESFKNPHNLQIYEISILQLPHLLRYEDRNSMRHSIETRLPFLDYRVVEMGISLKPNLKINKGWTKYILRKTVNTFLPEEIVWRKNKLGFEAPQETWLNYYENDMLEEIKKSKLLNYFIDLPIMIRDYHKLRLKDKWLYFNIAVWERVYKVKIKNIEDRFQE